MCSILGLISFSRKLLPPDIQYLNQAGKTLAHRGPDQNGLSHREHFAFQHNRLAVIDLEKGRQPMTTSHEGFEYTIVYNGELYNTEDLRQELRGYGVKFQTHCDTEVVLYSYIIWGEQCSAKFNGIYAFVVYDSRQGRAYLARDRFGVKPFFYTFVDGALLFASELKAILQHPHVKAQLGYEGLWQLLYMMPVKEEGTALFKNIFELPPASHAFFSPNSAGGPQGLQTTKYWSLAAYENREREDTIVATTRELLVDAIQRQLVADVPLCTFLSGGLDSSVITAVAAQSYQQKGAQLSTYSFEHAGNKEHFQQTLFQPQSDDEYALYLADYLATQHQILTAQNEDLVNALNDAVRYRDYPGMADIDSSLLYYCRQVKKHHTVALSGECADEVFGGYPWFYRPEMLTSGFFPWIHDPYARISLFRPEVVRPQAGFEYTSELYRQRVAACPVVAGESEAMRTSRIASWLSIHYFMTSLLERKDRMSMASGLEVRVPFADHRLVDYVYNVPWDIKYKNGLEKSLLRAAMQDYLPDKILYRKKSPFPKTHDPHYATLVYHLFQKRLSSGSGMLAELLHMDVLDRLASPGNNTWFGQLMGAPQLMAWLVQLDFWFEEYKVELCL
ncbi:asparagine synthase, glutamine-hydrolyzing [Desulfitobacterium dichloroeliminans LMG P-21439]|uniref:asparagine synthase (glutamine-hydrolyzing) n=1 Tax=Desulfitobacterium dichloroeliminans (strain LMG P-21439 / DCA1) TaxID=871963 RepID=L0F5K8_DESDL|nr:asparagine synthase (glutamine-hydrolyzing) [Desulfitobacterium dichloroeliminans]AGA68330.1 asparagine synthase, glutamine-hydrolyzing [Desulfitobacterium dichloroeliminans LMG P-21439]